MTNSEVEQALYCAKESAEITLCEECKLYETCDHSTRKDIAQIWVEALEENDKLKAEIEELQGCLKEWSDMYDEHINYYKKEIEQLKSDLERSVKLPCKCENCKYADFMGAGAERFFCMEHHRYMVVGGYCSFGKSEVSE